MHRYRRICPRLPLIVVIDVESSQLAYESFVNLPIFVRK